MMQQSAMHHTAECYAPYRKAVLTYAAIGRHI
jgi:hypothetical protein